MKRKKLWLILLIAVLVLAVPYWIFTGFRGSLVMRTVTTFKAKDYVAAHYPGQPYAVGFGRYDFKFMEYYCIVRSRDSEDTHFTVWCGADGMEDDYADWVEGRQNTAQRLSLALL